MFIVGGFLAFPMGAFLFIPAVIIFFTTYGTKIDVSKNKIMDYIKIFGLIEVGSWKDNNTYVEIAVMGSTTVHQGRIGLLDMAKYSARKITINLLDQYHVKRFELCEMETVEEANEFAKKISKQTGFPVVEFKPIKLTKTRRR
jgi:hypothetical protein